jgi:hypothetical protein
MSKAKTTQQKTEPEHLKEEAYSVCEIKRRDGTIKLSVWTGERMDEEPVYVIWRHDKDGNREEVYSKTDINYIAEIQEETEPYLSYI